MAVDKRVRMSPDDRREQLVSLGIAMLTTRPLDMVSIHDVAEKAQVSRTLPFHYFPTKRDFHLAIAREASKRLLARTEPDLRLDGRGRLCDGVANYIDFAAENREMFISFLRGAAGDDPQMRAILDGNRAAMNKRVVTQLNLDSAEPISDSAQVIIQGWTAFVEEVTISWLRQPIF